MRERSLQKPTTRGSKTFFISLLLMLFVMPVVDAQSTSQGILNTKVSVNFKDAPMLDVMNSLQKKSGINFIFDHNEIKNLPKITKSFDNATIKTILDECLARTNFGYSVVNGVIVIKRNTNIERITVFGTVTDENGIPLPRASIFLKSTKAGSMADNRGHYSFSFPKRDKMIIVVSFVGYTTREIEVTKSTELNVKLTVEKIAMKEVVVGGVYTMNRETYTGSAVTVTGEELREVSNINLVGALAALTPGMVIVENNEQGSNPNYVPEILIRGMSSLVTSDEERALNSPLIIMDGMEITIAELYYLDINDIERATVLKDASATVIYGDQAANGVILIERKKADDSKFNVRYSFTPNFKFPELSSINIMNSSEKLEFERLAGLYETTDGSRDQAYAYKLMNIRKGVDTDWISAPLRTSFSHNHSLIASGRGSGVEYVASTSFSDTYGVMKGDNVRNFDARFSLSYHTPFKLTIGYEAYYNHSSGKTSPYGSFGSYTRMNPYEPIYDEYGELYKGYYFDPYNPTTSGESFMANPLYNASLSSFNKTITQNFRNSVSATYYFNRLFFLRGSANMRIGDSQQDTYKSPDHTDFMTTTTATQKGLYQIKGSKDFDYDLKLSVHYSKFFNEEGSTGMRFQAGTNLSQTKSNSHSASYQGFYKDKMPDIDFANGYYTIGASAYKPSGGEAERRRVNFNAYLNFTVKNRYFADIIYNIAASSEYGAHKKWSPNWNFGLGWNAHHEEWLKHSKVLTYLSFRGTIGYNGLVGYNPYQALTWYQYTGAYLYYAGLGAIPISMGNPDLKWQKTLKRNLSAEFRLFDRYTFRAEYYYNTTKDLLIPIDVPASVGVSSTRINLGENINSGVELSFSGVIVKNNNFSLSVNATGEHTFDKIRNISEALQNTSYGKEGSLQPVILFREGGSQYDIYAMRSAGIDPSTGKEIFIKKDGTYTYVYDANEKVAVGNTNPTLRGNIGWVIRYKNFSISFTSRYEFGGDIYNATLYSAVENVSGYKNADKRAYTDRWKQSGDQSRYLQIGKRDYFDSERFVERYNIWEISFVTVSHDFNGKFIKRLGMNRLNLSFGVGDILWLSTVKRERGIDYPFCRTYSIGIKPTF